MKKSATCTGRHDFPKAWADDVCVIQCSLLQSLEGVCANGKDCGYMHLRVESPTHTITPAKALFTHPHQQSPSGLTRKCKASEADIDNNPPPVLKTERGNLPPGSRDHLPRVEKLLIEDASAFLLSAALLGLQSYAIQFDFCQEKNHF
jgi:hypothetical protein